MLIDFAIVLPIIAGGVFGFRDGAVRKLVSITATFGAMFVAKLFMVDLGDVMVQQLEADREWASLQAYLIIFFSLLMLQSLLYRVITGNYKFGGLADRIVGSSFGVVHLALVVSVVLAVFEMKGFPSDRVIKESRTYKPVRNVASQILDLVTQTVPQVSGTIEKFKEQGMGVDLSDTTRSVGKSINEMLERDVNRQVEEALKAPPSAQDSIHKNVQKR